MEALNKRPDIIGFVKHVTQEQGIEDYTIMDVQTNDKGEGYLGQIFTITLRETSDGFVLSLVVKAAFTEENVRKFMPIKKSFLNEIYFYTQLEPELRNFQKTFGITPSCLFPKCYKVFSKNEKELLCLQNLKMSNFEVFDKRRIFDDEHIRFIFKIYGQFHGYFFALKTKQSEEYKRLISKTYNIYDELVINPDGKFTDYLKDLYSLNEKLLVKGEDDEIIQKFEKYSGDSIINIFHSIVTEECDYSTILHGDCWSNNLMFKYEASESGKKLVDLRLIDFQLVKTGSPACDLSYCLYSGGSKIIYDNLDEYLKIYHESLSSCLNQFGCDSNAVFPFHILKDHWKKYSRFGMIMALGMLQIKMSKTEDILDLTDNLDDATDMEKKKFDKEEYKKRVKEVLYHMSEIDAL